jgi:hypothetical protein
MDLFEYIEDDRFKGRTVNLFIEIRLWVSETNRPLWEEWFTGSNNNLKRYAWTLGEEP